MDIHYPTIDEPATPEYVLAVLRDEHRQQCEFDDAADREISLSFDSTIDEWRQACDLVAWRPLGRAYNELYGIDYSDDEWYAVLEPAHQKRLRDVCELIARHARRPQIRPSKLFGCTCAPAGAFLTVRSLLQEVGAAAEEIAPSTPLAAYTVQYLHHFLGPISQLAPGTLPVVKVHNPVYDAAVRGLLAGMLCILLSTLNAALLIAGVVLFVICHFITSYASNRPTSVEFGDLRTFRDLAVAIAEGSSAEKSGSA